MPICHLNKIFNQIKLSFSAYRLYWVFLVLSFSFSPSKHISIHLTKDSLILELFITSFTFSSLLPKVSFKASVSKENSTFFLIYLLALYTFNYPSRILFLKILPEELLLVMSKRIFSLFMFSKHPKHKLFPYKMKNWASENKLMFQKIQILQNDAVGQPGF